MPDKNVPSIKIIAYIRTAFPDKFGIPRQSGLVPSLTAEIIFTPEFRNPVALRGIEGFSHLWLIWAFSEAYRDTWQPTVRPPRLGGNRRIGVFATRSPYRPNPIGLSSVKLTGIRKTNDFGRVLTVSGADLMDGTPILDIKPYLPFTDSHPNATGGFAEKHLGDTLSVSIPENIAHSIPEPILTPLSDVLRCDPRPSYQDDPDRIYGMRFDGYEVKFRVFGNILTVCSCIKLPEGPFRNP